MGVAGTCGENDDPAFFEVAHGAPADERFGHLMHLDRALQPRPNALLFKSVLKSQSVDDSRQHPHVVAGGAVDRKRLLARPTEDVAAADDDGHLHAQVVHFLHFTRNAVNGFCVDAETL